MALVDDFMNRKPEFLTTDAIKIDQYNTMLSVAALYIQPSIYGSFTVEAVFIKTASLLYQSSLMQNQITGKGQELSRSVSGEYSVTYANNRNQNTGKQINPYDDELLQLQTMIGLNLGGLVNCGDW